MFGGAFFGSVVPKIHAYCGNLFFRGQSIREIDLCDWDDLKYWNDWHVVMCEAENPKPKKGNKK